MLDEPGEHHEAVAGRHGDEVTARGELGEDVEGAGERAEHRELRTVDSGTSRQPLGQQLGVPGVLEGQLIEEHGGRGVALVIGGGTEETVQRLRDCHHPSDLSGGLGP